MGKHLELKPEKHRRLYYAREISRLIDAGELGPEQADAAMELFTSRRFHQAKC